MGHRNRKTRGNTDPSAVIRALRLSQLLREELNSILASELNDSRFDGVCITFVELSPDGARARVWFGLSSVNLLQHRQVQGAFEHASPLLRSRLCDVLPLKRTPELRFRYDPAALPPFEPK